MSAVIEKALLNAARNPFLNPPAKYKDDGDLAFREFELRYFRISYRISLDELLVVSSGT